MSASLMSKDKAPVEKEMKEKTNEFQQDKLEYIKSPVVMEFLGLPSDSSLKESKLESAIIDNLEKFLMEMGERLCPCSSPAAYPNGRERLLHRLGIL